MVTDSSLNFNLTKLFDIILISEKVDQILVCPLQIPNGSLTERKTNLSPNFACLDYYYNIQYETLFIQGSSCSTAVEHTPHDQEGVGSYPPAGYLLPLYLTISLCSVSLKSPNF